MSDNVQAQSLRFCGHLSADLPKADNSQSLTLNTIERHANFAVPVVTAHLSIIAREFAGAGKEQRQRMFCHFFNTVVRYIRDNHVTARSDVHSDIVDADAVACNNS